MNNAVNERPYIGYEYKKLTIPTEKVSMYLDCYESFGWEADENVPLNTAGAMTTLSLKRDRKIINKAELTRLQRHFEACDAEISKLEAAKNTTATIVALVVGIIGTAFIAGSVFAVTHKPPIIWLCIVLAVPGFIGWILPCFLHRSLRARKSAELQPLIEAKQDEIYELCEKGHALL